MKTLLTTVFLTTVYVLLCAILSADADQTIFDKELVERRPDVSPPHQRSHSTKTSSPIMRNTTKLLPKNPDIETLGFVTPWNNRGYDIVSPRFD
jgi:hypothetical protein